MGLPRRSPERLGGRLRPRGYGHLGHQLLIGRVSAACEGARSPAYRSHQQDRRRGRRDGLRDIAVALSLALATALERIGLDQDLAVEDLVEVWFAE